MTVNIPADLDALSGEPEPPKSSRGSGRYARALRSPAALGAITTILLVVVIALVVPFILPFGANEQGPDALLAPGGAHLLGTDEVGRDLLARLLAGTRVDLLVSLIAVPIAAVGGTLLGLIGMVSSSIGSFFQRVTEVLLGVPGIILGIAVAMAIGPGQTAVTIAIVLVTGPSFARQARSSLLSQMSRDYVVAGEVLGYSRSRLMMRHILPNMVDVVFVRFALEMARAITIEGSLSVVGLGIQPPQASLGAMISDGSAYLLDRPLYALAPVLMVVVLVFSYISLSNALNKAVLRA